MNYVYVKSSVARFKYTVGFYDPNGQWHPEGDYETKEAAAARVHYLNGGDMIEVSGRALPNKG